MKQFDRLVGQLHEIPHDQFLMHGSVMRLRHGVLVPQKQNIIMPNKPELCKKRVYATASITVALLYAVIDAPSELWDWRYMRIDGKFHLYCRVARQTHLRNGHVHIVPREPFEELQRGIIYSSRQRVRPTRTIRVPAAVLSWLLSKEEVKLVHQYPPDEVATRA